MQVRRMIAVLQKMIKKDPSIAYATVGVTAGLYSKSDYTVQGISEGDLGVEFVEWNNEITEPSQRQVLIIGVDQFRLKMHKDTP